MASIPLEIEEVEVIEPTGALEAFEILIRFAESNSDISGHLEDAAIADLTDQVLQAYDRDKCSREEWAEVAERALKDMTKSDWGKKEFPWTGSANIHYPLLPYAVMQFNARSYPAIVKGDEAVSCKVVGSDKGMPELGPDGQPLMQVQGMILQMTPQGPALINPQSGEANLIPDDASEQVMQSAQPMWKRAPGAKAKKANRIRDYMNYVLFYRMKGWESDTDTMLFQLPAIGLGFRKTWFGDDGHQSCFVPALRLVVNNDAACLDSAPQITEEICGIYPHQIRRDISTGKYRSIDIDALDYDARMLIEAQCYYDLDGDGTDEPYIVTIDYKSRQLLRVVPDFTADDVKLKESGVAFIERRKFYTKYEFLPNPEGKFYNIGLAHMLDQYSKVINTLINQMLDANTAAVAGGGFIGSGLRIQGQGQSSSLKFRPGEYKSVGASGAALRENIVDRTTPNLSPVSFNLLELILGAAENIASIKDVLSGDASNNGQVGTTLAMIEQGLQVFTAIYKRVYRALKSEFTLLYNNIGHYADEQAEADYLELLDDPDANLIADFERSDLDIRPISDPSSVTQMQRLARAQFVLSTVPTLQAVGGDAKLALRKVYEAANIDDIDELLPDPGEEAQVGQQMQMADAQATIRGKEAKANRDEAEAMAKMQSVELTAAELRLEQDKADYQALKDGMQMEVEIEGY